MRKPYLYLVITLIFFSLPLAGAIFNISLADFSSAGKCTAKDAHSDPTFGIRTIVIDPGHGGKDPGCSGKHSREKHIALAIAQNLRDKIEAQFPDINVILTRDEDVFIPLHERAAIANRNQADLFISIHCNYMPGSGATKGSETYVMGLHTADHNLEVAKRENDAILLEDNYETHYDYDPNSPEGHILLSLYQNLHLEQSIMFAEKVEFHFHTTAGRKSRGVKQAGFVVLKETAMPSVLVETGFLSSSSEEAFLLSEEGKNLASNAILNAFIEYKNTLEGVSNEIVDPNMTLNEAYTAPTPIPTMAPASTPPAQTIKSPAPVATVPQNYSSPPAGEYYPPALEEWETELSFGNDDDELLAQPTARPQNIPVNTPIVYPERDIAPKGGQAVLATSVPATEGDRASQPRKEVAGLIFAVQLAASPRPLNTKTGNWQDVNQLIEVIEEDQFYKYQARRLSSLQDAFSARADIQNKGFYDAFIVPYHNGERISMQQARALLDE